MDLKPFDDACICEEKCTLMYYGSISWIRLVMLFVFQIQEHVFCDVIIITYIFFFFWRLCGPQRAGPLAINLTTEDCLGRT